MLNCTFTRVEQDYRAILNEILLKSGWNNKIHDTEITSRWNQEIIAQQKNPQSESFFKFLLAELDFLSHRILSVNIDGIAMDIFPTVGHGIHWATSNFPPDFLETFLASASILEHSAFTCEKFHPDSKNMQLDLIHPSNCCFAFNRSLVASRTRQVTGDATVDSNDITTQRHRHQTSRSDFSSLRSKDLSQQYQWIPSDVHVDDEGCTRFLSYINDLDPQLNCGIEKSLESLLSHFIPLFELAIASFKTNPPVRINAGIANWNFQQCVENVGGSDGDDDEDEDRLKKSSITIPPLPAEFNPRIYNASMPSEIDQSLGLKGRDLQVIVKMSSIFLTPDEPRYNGGKWHLEGMANENIVATGIYYYSIENITSSRLTFRTYFDPDNFVYEQGEYEGLEAVYGFRNYTDLPVQWAGELEAREGLFVAFPNFAQHQVQKFQLADPTKPGHRKILCFFLVDPDKPILSTSKVPQQNAEWLMNELNAIFLSALPELCLARIIEYLGCTFTKEEIASIAKAVMKERSRAKQGGFAELSEISLCEH